MIEFDPTMISGLDVPVWERWVAYRISIRKSLKPASLHAAALKLARYGADQDAVVEQSIANQWTGLFDLRKSKPAPGEKPTKSREQVAADAARWEWQMALTEKSAAAIAADSMGSLRMMDAVLARLMFQQDDPSYNDRFETFRHRLGEMLASCDAAKAFGDPHVRSLVLQVYGIRGVNRLKARAGNP